MPPISCLIKRKRHIATWIFVCLVKNFIRAAHLHAATVGKSIIICNTLFKALALQCKMEQPNAIKLIIQQ